MNTIHHLSLIALTALLAACQSPTPVTTASAPPSPATAPQQVITSAATARGTEDVPPFNPAPPERAQPQQSNSNFNATAFEPGDSAPGIRDQYEAAARSYREAAAKSGSPEREQYLEAARQLDQQAAALGN